MADIFSLLLGYFLATNKIIQSFDGVLLGIFQNIVGFAYIASGECFYGFPDTLADFLTLQFYYVLLNIQYLLLVLRELFLSFVFAFEFLLKSVFQPFVIGCFFQLLT